MRARLSVLASIASAVAVVTGAGIGSAQAAPSSREACTVTPEICDHIDNDCDGVVDEGFPLAAGAVDVIDPQGHRVDEFGYAMAAVGDISGDGVSDFAVGGPMATVSYPGGTYPTAGYVAVVSGADRSVMCRFNDPAEGGYLFGLSVAAAGDLTGDGIPDIAVGTPGFQARDAQGQPLLGGVAIFSGADCSFARRCTDFVPISYQYSGPSTSYRQLGSSVVSIADVNGDGIADLLAGDPIAETGDTPSHLSLSSGRAVLFSGADCSVLQRFEGPQVNQNGFGVAVAGVGDLDSDGVRDVAIGASGIGSIFLYSGSSGALLRTLTGPESVGSPLVALGDIHHDGVEVLAAGARFDSLGEIGEAGSVVLFSLVDGALIRKCQDPLAMPTDLLGYGLASVGDLDGDGVPELAAGAPLRDSFYLPNAGEIVIFSGEDCSVLTRLDDTHGIRGRDFAYSVVALPGRNGDGRAEIASGAFSTTVNGNDYQGKVVLFTLDNDCDGDGASPAGGDCDDTDPSIGPDAQEVCDGRDNNCNGKVDEGFDSDADGIPACFDNCPLVANPDQLDRDGDGLGDFCDLCPVGGDPQNDVNGNGVPDCFDTALVDISISFGGTYGKGTGTVSWTTLSEFDTPSFNIVTLDARGRVTRLNVVPIPCEECGSGLGHVYYTVIPKHRSGHNVFVERVSLYGTQRYGPAQKK